MKVKLTYAIVQALSTCGHGVLTEVQDTNARARRIGEIIQAENPDGTPRALSVVGPQFQPDNTALVIVANGRETRANA